MVVVEVEVEDEEEKVTDAEGGTIVVGGRFDRPSSVGLCAGSSGGGAGIGECIPSTTAVAGWWWSCRPSGVPEEEGDGYAGLHVGEVTVLGSTDAISSPSARPVPFATPPPRLSSPRWLVAKRNNEDADWGGEGQYDEGEGDGMDGGGGKRVMGLGGVGGSRPTQVDPSPSPPP